MIGLDTNVVVRHLVQDDAQQGLAATKAFAKLTPDDPGLLTVVVLVEAYWVLTRGYKFAPAEVTAILSALADTAEIVVQDDAHIRAALALARGGADFADAVISSACKARGCSAVLSFDRRAQQDLGFRAP